MKFVPVIGLEIHVQLNTKSKLFCSCSATSFGKRPNTQVCPVCLGLPGAIPAPPNKEAIKKAVLAALALNCKLAEECRFERKNYFYPDLPKGYQISQYQTAVGTEGKFEEVKIRRVHLEEDAAKLIHESGQTLIDFNRAGIPLLEIVTEPDLATSSQVKAVLKELRSLLRYLKVSDADMEKGSMRLEANVSLRKEGAGLPPYKVELKNINSFNFLVRALEKEIARQQILLQMGRKIVQETRGYSEKTGETFSQRRKEEVADYRYFPEPDLPPLTARILTYREKFILPEVQRQRLEKNYHLPLQYIETLMANPELADLFEETVKAAAEFTPKEIANVVVNRRFGDPKKLGVEGLARALKMSKKKVQLPEAEVARYIEKIILDNPKAVSDYKAGKEVAFHFLLGALVHVTRGKVAPAKAKDLLEKGLKS
ncbi:Asp-tRNA(Asn)/Glu-tRNA(Gln) amidotransferase GatCAB subunit B [candidate division WWE3 bacterium CG10_big_fil_rev_8_21_14_0_10_48_23]|uniref:Aspartyl/glutamyl-tRNA(Asn/Gln) amidotransferase subunit B n=1 Tax=candidate division WWE3 bacterium CG_4_9_14_0_2_um_filter_48_10 TaxID=1975078 RepID=A0A2M8EIJ7_UNCKA|nr:MAG: Asp-tRNA(Asn)/Glu-tRNA(Gln) amidotransferase GatCAB subunit B [candidate division WWE3 bacterium CG_4_10_14_0_2_um_filter_47_8]PJC22445.1 MAG: Asp-tRNA(Asn)/Glu-tRNA(Gln) amidotransferase GatCAB subunit B [candidate division WWE3 bacterium CG_4_9_14_0_2_um_filter_48_10]PJE52292.1 MAG: Asp-tRNA(Asn)/Glu-tRNA(Gln) amidotransferase GatCAB subunit B [candidate division WWE3 bacterium CG10_big_fil_rev_8_21_14_0_10_48_23]